MEPGHEDEVWTRIRREMFTSELQSDPQGAYDMVRSYAAGTDELIFVAGRKICGDVHVPMRTLTWAALVHPQPPASIDDLSVRHVCERGVPGKQYRVIRSFPGWGTLAAVGFRSPSWNRGLLVQIEAETSCFGRIRHVEGRELHAFAFLWGRDGHEDAVVLRWLRVQEECPFFFKGTSRNESQTRSFPMGGNGDGHDE